MLCLDDVRNLRDELNVHYAALQLETVSQSGAQPFLMERHVTCYLPAK
jgi:hypothetical protein